MPKVIILPGNGGGKPTDNWFPYLETELTKKGFEVVNREFPDSMLARESFWIPFVTEELKAGPDSILVGHSSGAIAAMRFAEKNKILGSVLVGAYHTHLDMESEKVSGYFDRPWDWKAIRQNQQWIGIFASSDDPWIPIEEARFLHKELQADYFEYSDRGHFGGDYYKPTFPEIVEYIVAKVPLNDASKTFERT